MIPDSEESAAKTIETIRSRGRSHMMNPATTFLCGMGGSIAIELVALYEAYQTEPFRLPERYRKFWFYVVRVLLAMAAGGLAVVYEIDKPLLAVNVGVSAPLLLQTLARGLQHGGPNRGD